MKLHHPLSRKVTPGPLPRSVPAAARVGTTAIPTQAGVALVVTLILLAVITTLAIAFIALTHRETAAGVAAGATTHAELAAEAAVERALAEIKTRFIVENQGTNNGSQIIGPRFMVSVAGDQDRLNSAGAYRDPSPPVFVNTNPTANSPLDDRFFLDLNRNHYFDETGLRPVTTDIPDGTGRYQPDIDPATGLIATNWVVGDPMWIGLTQSPFRWHTNDNRYLSRYAWAVFPVGISLDINTIHNNAKRLGGGLNGYLRNQGVGTFELNLAAFLADLNFNIYTNRYQLNFNSLGSSPGEAFNHARELLSYRTMNRPPLTLDALVFPRTIGNDIRDSALDLYADGPVTTNGVLLANLNQSNWEWPGSPNNTNFYSVHDFLSGRTSSSFPNFQARLMEMSTNGNSYDRYTFSRMVSQLGMDTTTREDRTKINLNFNDVTYAAQDLVPWTNFPDAIFFRRVANRMLEDEFNIRLAPGSGIPIFTNGTMFSTNGPLYSSRIHQILQVTANIFDATHGPKYNERAPQPYYPSVFRPVFDKRGNDVYIIDYVEEQNTDLIRRPWRILEIQKDRDELTRDDNIYGIPIIIGARKGLPNFNEFVLETRVQVTRKLEFIKNSASDRLPRETNQMFFLGISNTFGLEAWFPYSNPAVPSYPRDLGVVAADVMITTLTNDAQFRMVNSLSWNYTTNILAASPSRWVSNTFFVTPISNHTTLVDSVLRGSGASGRFEPVSDSNFYERNQPPPTNRWGLSITNRLLFFLTDGGHIIDAVGLSGMDMHFDISGILNRPIQGGEPIENTFSTRGNGGLEGLNNQIAVSLGDANANINWSEYGRLTIGSDKNLAIDAFRAFFGRPPRFYPTNTLPAPSNSIQAPFTATRRLYQITSWSANDPIVHHRVYDLRDTTNNTAANMLRRNSEVPSPAITSLLSNVNTRYKPWGGRYGSSADPVDYNSATRDPLVFSPDYWDFPTNQFPNPGWLGRVHRGTPWQTIYFKSRGATPDEWSKQSGAAYSLQTHPTNDWRLADIFTSVFHPNAARGQMAINQTNLAAWSALLSGVVVSKVTNNGTGLTVTNDVIEPAVVDDATWGADSAVPMLVRGVMAKANSLPGRQFHRLSDIFSVPEFTDRSPFMSPPRVSQADYGLQQTYNYPANDADYERIPQQVLGLMRLGEPRFVIYAWGQSLKPAEFGLQAQGKDVFARGPSVETAGDLRGLVKNYQITGELATRTVVRIEFEVDPVNTNIVDYSRPRAVIESFNIIPPD